MIFVDVLLALVLALLFVAIFSLGFGRPGPWGSALWFFLVVFLGTVAVAAWTEPVGPLVMGVAWLPIFVAALFLALLVAAATPVRPPARKATADPVEAGAEAAAAGVLLWTLLIGLFVVGGIALMA